MRSVSEQCLLRRRHGGKRVHRLWLLQLCEDVVFGQFGGHESHWCARESCEDLVEMLHTDQFLDRDTRRVLTFLYESQPDRPKHSFELRMITGGDALETHRFTGGRPTRREQR